MKTSVATLLIATPCNGYTDPYGVDPERDDLSTIDCSNYNGMCTREYMPICRNDGHTSSNVCVFLSEYCMGNVNLRFWKWANMDGGELCPKMLNDGGINEKKEEKEEEEEEQCNLNCPRMLDFVCGTDGVKYPNPCILKGKACQEKTNVHWKWNSASRETTLLLSTKGSVVPDNARANTRLFAGRTGILTRLNAQCSSTLASTKTRISKRRILVRAWPMMWQSTTSRKRRPKWIASTIWAGHAPSSRTRNIVEATEIITTTFAASKRHNATTAVSPLLAMKKSANENWAAKIACSVASADIGHSKFMKINS